MGIVDNVVQYFIALIVGVILLSVLWEVVITVMQDVPELYKYGFAIVIAAAVALVALARGGFNS